MTRLSRLGGIFVSPRATLEYVSIHPDLLLPYLVLLAWLAIPTSVVNSIKGRLGIHTVIFAAINLAMVSVMLLLVFALKGGILSIFGRFFGGEARFYSLLCIGAYAHFPQFLRDLAENGMKFVKPGVRLPTGLGALFPNSMSGGSASKVLVSILLGSIEIFTLWSLLLTILGVYVVFKFRLWKAIIVTFSWWIVFRAFILGFMLLTRAI